MRGRGLLACTAVVLAAHGGLLLSLSRHGRHGAEAAAGGRGGQRLVILDAARVAALTRVAAPDAGSSAPLPTAVDEAPPASTRQSNDSPAPAPAAGVGIYRPVSALDVPIRPRSAPDLSLLAGLSWSGLPLRIRLFIDADGQVADVQVLKSAEQPEVDERVRQMFLATGFTGGVENGRPVPCFKDIELDVGKPA